MLRKRTIVVGIIIFSIITVGVLVVSPILIDSRVNPNSQWVAFYASYLGGIFGGVVSGSLTLGGVYLTIRYQNKLLNQEKAAKFDYVFRDLEPRFWTLNEFVKNTAGLSTDRQIQRVQAAAIMFLKHIKENRHIIETDFKLLRYIESVEKWLNDIAHYGIYTDGQIIEDFEMLNTYIQLSYEKLQEYDKSLH